MQRLPKSAWILSDGTAGALNQSLGFVERLALERVQIITCLPRGLFRLLPSAAHLFLLRWSARLFAPPAASPSAALGAAWWSLLGLQQPVRQAVVSCGVVRPALGEGLVGLEEGWPDLIVASGRRTAPANFLFKVLSEGTVKIIQIQHPRAHSSYFDVIITPEHDKKEVYRNQKTLLGRLFHDLVNLLEGPQDNIVYTLGSLHRVNEVSLRDAKFKWITMFGSFTSRGQFASLLIGGFTSNYSPDLHQLLSCLEHIFDTTSKRDGYLLISFSRRTSKELRDLVSEIATRYKNICWVWNEKGDNPYIGMLACSSDIFVTADSVGMVSEAISSGNRVYLIMPDVCSSPKFRFFHWNLLNRGYVKQSNCYGEVLQQIDSFQPSLFDDTGDAVKMYPQIYFAA